MDNRHLEELHKQRNGWVKSTKENNFDGGIYKLLTELYPDNAHFIYELLQNAEDTDATEVVFELSKNELKFIHNGRPFIEKDVEGITSIGQGTKADDVNQIGKFGVGFKAVFTYTSSPKIFSGDYNFEINDLVVPLEIKSEDNLEGKTLMKFPFNNPDKPKEKAFNEIKSGLAKLHDNTLLFLNSIKKIKYNYGNVSNTIERENVDEVRVIISNEHENSIESWLRFKKYLPTSKKLFVSVAYRISEDIKTKKEVISPVNGAVSIYFPAEKETSNLKFHIHAPFASTVARDSIKNLEENNELRDLIADLSSESLEYIKNNNFLDFNFLTCLPIIEDNIPTFYKPIQDCLVDTFNNHDYIVCENGLFKSASLCYRSSKNIKNIIDTEMLKVLEDIPMESSIYWIINPSQKNNREDKFLQSLNIKSVSPDNLVNGLKGLGDCISRSWWKSKNNYSEKELKSILESKNNKWVKRLYELLFDLYNKNDVEIDCLGFLIKLEDNTFNYQTDSCYFANELDDVNGNFNHVNREVYEKNPNAKNQKSKLFLKEIGVKEIELKEKVQLILNEYYSYSSEEEISKTKHLSHWRVFLKYYKETRDATLFEHNNILLNNQEEFVLHDEILLDLPFLDTNLHLIDGKIEGYQLLHELYNKVSYKDDFVSILQKIDVNICIPISNKGIFKHRNFSALYECGNTSDYTKNDDYEIQDLDQLLVEKSVAINKLVWKTMIRADKKVLKARYRRIKTSIMNTAPSTLVYDLMNEAWIPDKEGKFYKPSDISKEMLPDDFEYDNTSGWLTDIKFGETITKDNEDYKEKEKAARELSGLTPETLKKVKDSGYKDDDILKLIENDKESKNQNIKRPDLKKAILNTSRSIDKNETLIDPDIVKDEKEYIQKAQEQLEKNIKNSYRTKIRYNSSYKVKIGKRETKEFLKNQYKGHCQICGFTFDLKDNKGKYFETFDWFSKNIAKQETNLVQAGSSLCLCPTCHSMLKYGDFNPIFMNELEEIEDLSTLSFEDFIDLVQSRTSIEEVPEEFDFIEMDMHKTSIRLLNINQQIFYTEEHFLHLFNMMTIKETQDYVDDIHQSKK